MTATLFRLRACASVFASAPRYRKVVQVRSNGRVQLLRNNALSGALRELAARRVRSSWSRR